MIVRLVNVFDPTIQAECPHTAVLVGSEVVLSSIKSKHFVKIPSAGMNAESFKAFLTAYKAENTGSFETTEQANIDQNALLDDLGIPEAEGEQYNEPDQQPVPGADSLEVLV